MKQQFYIMLILLSVIIGGMAGFMAREHARQAGFLEASIKKGIAEAERIEAEVEEAQKKLTAQEKVTEQKRTEARVVAIQLLNEKAVVDKLKRIEGWYRRQLDSSEFKAKTISRAERDFTEKVNDASNNIDDLHKDVQDYYKLSDEELEKKKEILERKSKNEKTEYELELSKIKTEIDKRRNELNRSYRATNTVFEKPEVLGRVIQVVPVHHLVVINLGASHGVKQNYKFRVFGVNPNGDRIDKGFIVIREVEPLISVGRVMSFSEGSQSIVRDDSVGNPAFRTQGRTFFLAGDFRTDRNVYSKYTKEELRNHLVFMGNRVMDDLTYDVDMVVEGVNAERLLAQAASLGIMIIRDEQLVPYLGD